jgi:hypothetical protein
LSDFECTPGYKCIFRSYNIYDTYKKSMNREENTMNRGNTDNREQIIVNRGKKGLLLCSLITVHCSLIIVLCSLFCVGCELLNAPEVDIGNKIDAAVDWERAANINVSIANPPAWGQGTISPHVGAYGSGYKAGYAFTGEFTPDAAYTFGGWRLYRTGSLPAGWMDDPAGILGPPDAPGVAALAAGEGSVEPGAKSGSYAITVNITENVTLVPWCEDEPRITRTDPAEGAKTFNSSRPIIIYFAAALNPGTVTLGGDGITIKGRSITHEGDPGQDADYTGYFDDISPRYDSYTRSITITSNVGAALTDTIITVTVGTGVKSGLSGIKGMKEPYSFSYRIEASPTSITSVWSATYTPGKITGTHTQSGGESRTAYYSVDGGMQQNLTLDGNNFEIPNVPALSDTGVTNGNPVGNVHEYRIFIYVYAGGEVVKDDIFKIWNIPDMSVNQDNLAVEIDTQAKLAAILTGTANAGKNYVLTQDITLTGWTPIGTSTSAFQGKFYGNGHTVTVNSLVTAADTGLFGVVSGSGLVRDISVAYNNVTVPYQGGVDGNRFGGIAVSITGGEIRNVLVIGEYACSANGAHTIGGIAGSVSGTATIISNVYSALAITSTQSGSTKNIGGIAGQALGSGTNSKIENALACGDITMITSYSSTASQYIGGLAGSSSMILSGSRYRDGFIRVTASTSGNVYLGGAIGNITGGSSDGCYSAAGGVTLTKSNTGISYFGGYAGRIAGTVSGCYSTNPVSANNTSTATGNLYVGGFAGASDASLSLWDCYATGDVESSGYAFQQTGGLLGSYITNSASNTANIVRCYATGKVTAVSNTDTVTNEYRFSTGGLVGSALAVTIRQSWASGDVYAGKGSTGTAQVNAGGLVGIIGTTGNSTDRLSSITDCYATGNVIADNPNSANANVYAGGLVGYVYIATDKLITTSYAVGSVTAKNAATGAGAWAGGIAGYIMSGPVQNCVAAALNTNGQDVKITAKGNSSAPSDAATAVSAGRVYGGKETSVTVSDNYANIGIGLGTATGTGGYYNFSPTYSLASTGIGAGSLNGANATNADLRGFSWWTGTVVFGTTNWDFGSVGYKRPMLVGVGGQ